MWMSKCLLPLFNLGLNMKKSGYKKPMSAAKKPMVKKAAKKAAKKTMPAKRRGYGG